MLDAQMFHLPWRLPHTVSSFDLIVQTKVLYVGLYVLHLS